MKKTTLIVIGLIIIIICLLIYSIFICPQKRTQPSRQGIIKILYLPKGVPIKADGNGGVYLGLSTRAPYVQEKLVLKVEETKGRDIIVKVDYAEQCTVKASSYWCETYDYVEPFHCKYVEVYATDNNDPDFNNYHARAFIDIASPLEIDNHLPDVAGSRTYNPRLNYLQDECDIVFEINYQGSENATIIEEYDSQVSNSIQHPIPANNKIVIFLHYVPGAISNYKLTLNNGNAIINTYYIR